MRAVIQRVKSASVTVVNNEVGSIGSGLLVLLGVKATDTIKERDYIIKKILNMRIFSDDEHKMNKSVQDINGEILLVSQFTLYANCNKGNRPSFTQGMPYEQAQAFFDDVVATFKQAYPKIQTGEFGAYMQVELVNDGPVTIVLDSP